MRATILGCGSSGGTPLLGPEGWADCDPKDPRNRRRRASILVEHDGTRLLIDTSPDLREQLLAAQVSALDAVVYTHAHADHLHGIDDLRAINYLRRKPIDIWADPKTLAEIKSRFAYAFGPPPSGSDRGDWYRPVLTANEYQGPFRIGPIDIVPFEQRHGRFGSMGLRFGPLAYSTDVKTLDEAAFAALAGVEVWIVDCLRKEPHLTHSHLEQTLAWIARVKPRRAVLTHLDHTMDYAAVRALCPPGVEPGVDGMTLDC